MADRNPIFPLRLDATALLARWREENAEALQRALRSSEAARSSLVAAAAQAEDADEPLTRSAAVYDLPDQLLRDYQHARARSDLGRVLKEARRAAAEVDRVVVLGDAGFLRGVRALLGAGCHPRHNDLNRGERSGQPRVYLLDIEADNDEVAGLLDLFNQAPAGDAFEQRWALVGAGGPCGVDRSATIWRHWVEALERSCGDDPAVLGERLALTAALGETLPIALPTRAIAHTTLPNARGLRDSDSPFAPASLFVAGLAGMDIVRLLRGAGAMNARFRDAAIDDNAPLTLAAIVDAMAGLERGRTLLGLAPATAGLQSIARWFEGLLLSGRRPRERGPLAILLPADSSNAEPKSDACRDEFLPIHLTVDGARRDRLAPANDLDRVVKQAASDEIALRLPLCDESSVGQLLQLVLLTYALIAYPRSPDG